MTHYVYLILLSSTLYTTNQLESKVSLNTIYCLRLFVVYKHNVAGLEEMVGDTYTKSYCY